MAVNKSKVYLLTILIIVILAELTLVACQHRENVTTTVKPDYEELWGIDIGLNGFEIVNAEHELEWKGGSVKLTVNKSPLSLRRVFVNHFEARIENDRTYYFSEMEIAYDGTKSPNSTGLDMQGTIPYGREMQWESDKYLFSIQAESMNGNYSSLNADLVSIHSSQLIEKNFYHNFSDLKLQKEYWQVDLASEFAEIKIYFLPDAFGEQHFQDFAAEPTVIHVNSESGSYYQKDEIEKSSSIGLMTLAWKTDKGIFQLFFFSRGEQGSDCLSSINMDFIKHISSQVDASMIG